MSRTLEIIAEIKEIYEVYGKTGHAMNQIMELVDELEGILANE
jgi:hypothetical protein